MKKAFLLFFVIVLASFSGFSKTKKVKIKGDKTVQFFYDQDSTCLGRKESVKLVYGFHQFYKAVKNDDYQAYLDCLSPATMKRIVPDKLKRKYGKFVGYGVNLVGDISIRSIKKSRLVRDENEVFYTCIAKLPDGQTIKKRVGFDPLKRFRFEGVENYISLLLIPEETCYKVVIPW